MITLLLWFVLIVFTLALIGFMIGFHTEGLSDIGSVFFFLAILIAQIFVVQFLFFGGIN